MPLEQPTTPEGDTTPEPAEPVVFASVGPSENSVNNEEEVLPDIPRHAQYLLIGAGTASFGAFRAIRAKDATAKVSGINSYNLSCERPLILATLSELNGDRVNVVKPSFSYHQYENIIKVLTLSLSISMKLSLSLELRCGCLAL